MHHSSSEHRSSFDFGSEHEDSGVYHAQNDTPIDIFVEASDSDSMMSFNSNVSDEEIWSDTDEIDDPNDATQGYITAADAILSGICLFLNFFQLFYRVSERAMRVLLDFFQMIFAHLASLSQNVDLIELSSKFPKSLE